MQKVNLMRFFSARGLVMLGAGILLVMVFLLITPEGSEAATITVDDDGPADYSKIQEAVDIANPGDTVYVYNGIYLENVTVNKTISLMGEDRENTIINAGGVGDVVLVSADWVNVSGFTIINSGSTGFPDYDAGVEFNNVENSSVFNNIVLNNQYGIYLYNSKLNELAWNNVSSSTYSSVRLYYSNENYITGNSVCFNFGTGVSFTYSNLNKITSNIISWNNYDGIGLYYSNENNIINNTLSSNQQEGIYIYNSDSNYLMGNSIITWETDNGIYLSTSDGNIIAGNDLCSNNQYGLFIIHSNSNNITGNNISYNGKYGIYLDSSNQNDIINNNVSSNDWYGINLYGSNSNNIINNTVSLNGKRGVLLQWCIGNNLRGNTMIEDGIFIYGDSLEYWDTHNIASSNTVNGKPVYYWKNQTGGTIPIGAGQVILVNCTNVKIENQNLTYGDIGITVAYSSNNIIKGNNASNNCWYGIELYCSTGNNVTNNNASNNEYGIYLYNSSRNDINGNIVFWNNYQGIVLGGSGNNITINTISMNDVGIGLGGSDKNNIIDNIVSWNNVGLDLWFSDENNICSNSVCWNNDDGIYLSSSSNNRIFHNQLIGNVNQAYDNQDNNYWDNGYPFGGNYWSDYLGVDLFSGPNQDQGGNDNIGDERYNIDSDSQDNYPLMSWGEEILTNHDYDGLWHNSSFTISLIVSGGEGGITYIYYKINDGALNEVAIDGQPYITTDHANNTLEFWSVDNVGNEETHRFLYNIKLDKTSPATNDDYNGLWYNSNFTITLTAHDGVSGINETYYRINDGPIKRVSIAGQPFILDESDNNALDYWSIDNLGNEETHKILNNIKLDKISPSTNHDYDGFERYSDFTIILTALDVLSGVNNTFYRINNGDIQYISIDGQPLITTESENNTLEYWSIDVADNIEEHHIIYDIKLNKTYPDLMVSSEDIVFSRLRLIEDSEVYLNATIHNIGNLSASAKIKFYDGEPNIGLLIGSITISVSAHNSNLASVLWNTTLGNYNIYVLIENSIPEEPFTGNNVANKSVVVEVRPVLVLSVGDINVFRFESGEERTVPVYVSCYNNSAINVRLVVLDDRNLNITVVTPPQNISKDGSFTFYLRIRAPVLKEDQEYKEEDILLQAISDETTSNEEFMDVIVGRAAAELFWWFVLLGGASAGAGTLGFVGGTEIGKYALFAAAMSLYTRLTRKDVEDQETRGMIRGYILANPGEHYNAIKRALGLKNGNLAYHLKKLEKENLIKSARDGRYKRFYPPGMKIPEDVFTLNKIQEIILGEIIKAPGISQKGLSETVGLSTSTINYHISVMTNSGFVRIERKGKHTMCYPGNGVA